MEKDISFEIWKRERAKGVILEYLRGIKKVSLIWVLGCLKGNMGLSKNEISSLIKEIKQSSLLKRFPERKSKLRKIELALKKWKKIPSYFFPSVWKIEK